MMTILLNTLYGILFTFMLALFGLVTYWFITELFVLEFDETFYDEIDEDYATISVCYTIPEAIEAIKQGSKLKFTGLF